MIFYKYLKYEQKMKDQSEYFSTFPYLKHLQALVPSFITIIKPLSNKIAEIFCEGLKRMCKIFEIDGKKHPIIGFAQGISY